MFRIQGLAAAALATFLWSAAIAEGGHGHGGGGGGGHAHGGGGGRPSYSSAPRVSGGVIHSSGISPAVHSSQIGSAQITSSGIRAAALDPAIGGVLGRRSVSTFAAFESDHHHHLNGADLFLFGIGAPFGLYGGLFPAYYPGWDQGGFGYSPFGYGGLPGYGLSPQGYPMDPNQVQPQTQPVPNPNQPLPFAEQGLRDFDMRKYSAAAQNWRQALGEDSRNPRLVLLFAQGLFQSGQFDEAAGAVQYALTLAPQKQWAEIAPRFSELYQDNIFDYSNRLRELEKARAQKNDDPALRFLLGYHYAFLGYADEAVRELDVVQKLAPKDDVAKQLREMMAAKRK